MIRRQCEKLAAALSYPPINNLLLYICNPQKHIYVIVSIGQYDGW